MPSTLSLLLFSLAPGLWCQAPESTASASYSEKSVLENLVQFDSIYRAGFTASATQHRMDRIDFLGPFHRVEAKWKLTFQGDRVGYDMEVVDYDTPQYLPPEKRRWLSDARAAKVPNEEVMLVAVKLREWGYWGDQGSGTMEVDQSLKIAPDGRATKSGTMYNSYLYSAKDVKPIAYRYSFQWALGRFFSDRIEKITSVENLAAGRIRVSALGNMYAGNNGRWDLEVEPEAGWIVRKSRFYTTSTPNQITSEMINEGTVWSGSFCIPKDARVNFFGPVEDLEAVPATFTRQLTFAPVVDKFDETLYKICEQSVLNSKQPQLLVTDARVSPEKYTQPNRVEAPVVKPARPLQMWLVVGNVIVTLVLFLLWTIRRRFRRANAS